MKTQICTLTLAAGLLCAVSGFAQTATPTTPAVAKPAAATPAAMPAPTTAATPAPAPAATPATTPAKPAASPAPAAAGGGEGKVWVNTKSHVYHCEGSKSYGKTKAGEYMTEADAKTKGNHADHGKACGK